MQTLPDAITGEQWKPVRGFESLYEVSNHGRIRSYHSWRGIPVPRILNTSKADTGYLVVHFKDGQHHHSTHVHAVVAKHFIGDCPPGMMVNHKDLNKTNNREDNLEYLTNLGNVRHAQANGRFRKGSQVAGSKLTEAAVRAIRKLLGHVPQRQISKRFNISQQGVSDIASGKTWGHVK